MMHSYSSQWESLDYASFTIQTKSQELVVFRFEAIKESVWDKLLGRFPGLKFKATIMSSDSIDAMVSFYSGEKFDSKEGARVWMTFMIGHLVEEPSNWRPFLEFPDKWSVDPELLYMRSLWVDLDKSGILID